MRTIKFRGLKKDGTWIYGMPTYDFEYIFNYDQTDSLDNYEVDPKTVTEFTGLSDKNGKEIYEGDIVNSHANFEFPYFREVVYDRCGLTFKPQSGFILCKENEFHFEVIGNKFERPELLSTNL